MSETTAILIGGNNRYDNRPTTSGVIVAMTEHLITAVLQHYFPDWTPPENLTYWNQTTCPAHQDDRPSFTVNYQCGAVRCHACGFRGDTLSIIASQEGVTRGEAVEIATRITGTSRETVLAKPAKKSSRRVFGESGTGEARGREVPSWLR